MFGKKAPPKDEPSADEASLEDKSQAASSGAKVDEGETVEEHQTEEGKAEVKDEEPPKPKKPSWWRSALSNIDISSLISTAQGAMDDPGVNAALGKHGKGGGEGKPDPEQLMKALAAQQNATGLLQKAQGLKDNAMKCLDPKERQRMVQEAYDKEIEANGQSKFAKRLQSGSWQGGAGGAGAGAGVGMGLGTVLGTVTGTLLGGVVSLPTTALGGLVGLGVGSIHGPFVKLDQSKAKAIMAKGKAEGKSEKEIEDTVKEEALEEMTPEEIEQAKAAGKNGEGAEAAEGTAAGDEESQTPTESSPTAQDAAISEAEEGSAQPDLQRQHSSGIAKTEAGESGTSSKSNEPRKKPKKLEVRSAKKPRKLEVRSAKKSDSQTTSGKENEGG